MNCDLKRDCDIIQVIGSMIKNDNDKNQVESQKQNSGSYDKEVK